VAGLLFDSSATIALGGATYPGASAKAGNNVTALFEVGYFATKNISVQFTGGYPPTATLTGAGSLAGFGALGKATYGPAAVTVSWHFKELGAFQPYVGVGAAYAIIFGTSDGVVKNLSIPGAGAFVVQGGADYYLNRNWSLFVDAKYILLGVNATGNALGQPVVAHVNLDPTVISGGVSYHW
jgi:outer membrane protein